MSTAQRIGILAAIVVVAVVGFVILKPDDNASSPRASTSTSAAPAATAPSGGDTGSATSARPEIPAAPRIVVRGFQPVAGITRITVRKGETIRFTVVSDQPEEIHLHGYDVARDVAPGRPARFAVPATIEGIFEAELEHHGRQILSITVEP